MELPLLSTQDGMPVLGAILAILITVALMMPRRKANRDTEPDEGAKIKATIKGNKSQVPWPTPHQVLGLIQQRRSIFPKDYDGSAPSSDCIDCMLEAANWAPTHGKTEPWRFVVMSGAGKEEFEEMCHNTIKETLGEDSEKYQKYLEKKQKKAAAKAKVSHLIAICMKRQTKPDKLNPEWEEMAACSCAVQNMHLMATSMGVASYWSTGGPLESPNLLNFLGLTEEGDRCLGLFHVGMAPKEKVQAYRATRGPIDKKVTWLS
mmetsp:Transcript_30854/g.67372  ORF Transcript_30854/g.67372 Transcript_30854/m.67372 type:complete len:262 (-) Transcript_30854:109-894(-)|eukprot:CAMPEP_0118941894 /NCGR_PEP_ID=MMETSP1169-20130426/34918_1 /TAXON_ID=36882 /ORGANISM="Pyramimonas obovata, Strain CCMP722" /LENGTH=261 /DNA_ID=CAMNT_0006886777 /DNA_START=59 /DNA_END=844 /DNA_ORIENTATION=+